MVRLAQKHLWLFAAAGAILLIGMVAFLRPRPSAILSDGTVVRLESIQRTGVVSTWDKLILRLMDFDTPARWLDKLGLSVLPDESGFVVEFSTTRPDRFLLAAEDPVRWVEALPDHFDNIEVSLRNAHGDRLAGEITRPKDSPFYQARFIDNTDFLPARFTLELTQRDGKQEQVSLVVNLSPTNQHSDFRYYAQPFPSLPIYDDFDGHTSSLTTSPPPLEIEESGLRVRLESLPVSFDENDGARVFWNGVDVTKEVFLQRRAYPWNAATLPQAEWAVEFAVLPKSFAITPPKRRLHLPVTTPPKPGEILTFDSAQLNPNFPPHQIFFMGSGTYFIENGKIEINGTAGPEGTQPLYAALREMQDQNDWILGGHTDFGRAIFARSSNTLNQYCAYIEARRPFFLLKPLPNQTTSLFGVRRPDSVVLWENGIPQDINYLFQSITAGTLESGRPLDINFTTMPIGIYRFLSVTPNQAEQEAWAKHYENSSASPK